MPNVRNKGKNDVHVITRQGNFTLAAGKVTAVDDAAWKAATEPKAGVGLAEPLADKTVEVVSDPATDQPASALPDGPLPEGSTPAQVAAAQQKPAAREAAAPAPVPADQPPPETGPDWRKPKK